MFVTLVMLICVLYIFAIGFRVLAADTELNTVHHLFEDVPGSMFTLVCQGLYMDRFSDLAGALSDEGPGYLMLLLLFVFVCCHTILNLLVGVLCDVVSQISEADKFEILVRFVSRRLMYIVEKLRINSDAISKTDFISIIKDETAIDTFKEIDLDPVGIVDFIDTFFAGEHASEDGTINFAALADIVLSLRGGNKVNVKDLSQVRRYIHVQFNKLHERLDSLASVSVESQGFSRRRSHDPGRDSPRRGDTLGGRRSTDGTKDDLDASSRKGSRQDFGASIAMSSTDRPEAGFDVNSAWEPLRPAAEAVIRESLEVAFEKHMCPHLEALGARLARVSTRLDLALCSATGVSAGAREPAKAGGGADAHWSIHGSIARLELSQQLLDSESTYAPSTDGHDRHAGARLMPEATHSQFWDVKATRVPSEEGHDRHAEEGQDFQVEGRYKPEWTNVACLHSTGGAADVLRSTRSANVTQSALDSPSEGASASPAPPWSTRPRGCSAR